MMLSFFLQLFIFLIILNSVFCVKTCHFCFDLYKVCQTHLKRSKRLKMACSSFKINEQDNGPLTYLEEPKWLVKQMSFESLFSPELKKRKTKTMCLTANYKFKNNPQLYTLKTCTFRKLAHYNNACEFYADKFSHMSIMDSYECKYCKTSNCNSTSKITSSRLFLLCLLFSWMIFE